MIVFDVICCVILFVLGFKIKTMYAGYSKFDIKILDQLYIYHVIIGIAFYLYITSNGGDAEVYWEKAREFDLNSILKLTERGSATGFILLVNYIPAQLLKLSFFTGSFFHIVLGYWGILLFYNIIKENVPYYSALPSRFKLFSIPLFPGLLFLPNLHFWTSGLGKDTILFFCIAIFLYSVKNIRKRFVGLLAGAIIGVYIRPHIILFLMIAFGGATLFDNKMKTYQKALIIVASAVVFSYLFGYVMNFIRLESFDAAAIENFSTNKTKVLSRSSGSGVDTSNYPFVLKVFTFLYRPLFFDINGALAILSSFENLILLIFTFKIFAGRPSRVFRVSNRIIKTSLFFFALGALTFSLILGNLGIMLRQKVPFIFALIVFGYAVLSYTFMIRNRHRLKINRSGGEN